jgi:hypothetical protein
MAKVDGFVPETQDVNLGIVCQPFVGVGDLFKKHDAILIGTKHA